MWEMGVNPVFLVTWLVGLCKDGLPLFVQVLYGRHSASHEVPLRVTGLDVGYPGQVRLGCLIQYPEDGLLERVIIRALACLQ